MSENNCNGGRECSCGCPSGNCICGEKSTFKEGVDILLDIIAEAPIPLQAKVLIGFLYEYGMFLKFAFEEAALIKRETELTSAYIMAGLNPDSNEFLIAEANLEAFKAARQIRNQREHALREAEAPDKVARAVTTMFAPLIRASGQGISADEITARLTKSLEDCGCCGDEDDDKEDGRGDPFPTPGNPGGEEETDWGSGGNGNGNGNGGSDSGDEEGKDNPGGGAGSSGSGNTSGDTRPKGDRIPGMFDPLILDLNHNGQIDTTDINTSNGSYFDIDGTDGGIRERMGWVGEGDGFLVQDKNGNGKIDGIVELFGNSTTNAFDDLRARMDSNGDGIIDSRVGLI